MRRPYGPSRPVLFLICFAPVIIVLLALIGFLLFAPDNGVGQG
jgi:hypothetical protein